jgi:hypothetical protein
MMPFAWLGAITSDAPCPASGYTGVPNWLATALLTNTLSFDPSAFLRSVHGEPVVWQE